MIFSLSLAIAAGPLAAQTTFTNSTTILLPVPPGTGSLSNAVPGEPGSPYPSTINVSGLGTQIQKLTVTINDFRHTGPDDVDMLLVGPQGQKMIIWSDVGQLYSTCSVDFGTLDCNNAAGLGWAGPTVTLDDAALGDLSNFQNSAIVTGTYKPTNVGSANDMFPSPAPIGPYASPRPDGIATFASVFNGANPNGAWSLYVIDDAVSFSGRIKGGWSLTITTGGTALLPTTTTLTGATPNPSNVGQSVTVQYSVTAAAGAPSGFVTVTDGVNSCTGTVAAGGCVVAFSTPGDRMMTATYSGNTVFAPSAATRAQRVRTSTTTAIVADTPDPSSVGQAVSVRYAVTPAAAGGPAPTGTVRVTDGVHACTGTVADGACSIALGTPGARTLTATYAGDSYNLSSVSAGAAHQVSQIATTTAIVGDTPDPSVVGQPYTVSYSVAVTPPGTATPTGTVKVSDGAASCTGTLPATSCVLTSTTAGAKSLTATYNGDASFGGSTSAAAPHQVNKAATTTVIVSDTPDPSAINQPYTVTYRVAVTAPGAGPPSGTVTVSDGTASCTGTLPATSCVLTSTTPGSKSLSATYSGDTSFSGSVSSSASHQVSQRATTTAIVSNTPDPSVVGQPYVVSYSVAVTPLGTGTPTGTVTVSDGAASCTGTLPATSCALTSTTAGAKSLTATYNGDASFGASTSAAAPHQVNRAATTTVIVSDTPDPSAVNQPYTVTYRVAVTAPGAGSPSGTVTVSDGTASCTRTLPATSCQLPGNTPGMKWLTATYSGDTNFSASISAAAPHEVKKTATTTAIVSDTPDPSAIGQSVVIAYAVTGTGSPTGTVTISDGVVSCSGSVAAGQCALTFTTPGEHALSATYSGDANFTGSLGSATHRVLYKTTTAIISHSPDPSAPGQGFTVTYAVAPTVAGGPAPTGAVTVSDGVNACVGTVAAGSCLLVLNTAGTRTLTAHYAGDGANASSASAGTLHTVGAPDLTITKTHAGVFSPGQMGATYTIKVINAGGAPSAGTVTVADSLPAGLIAAGISGAGWNCAQPAGPCSRSDALAVNGSFPSLTLVVNVATNAPLSVTNVATVSGGGDSNASNNTASDPTSTAGALQGILTITKWGSSTGTVASADGGIHCGATCQHSYVSGTTITIEATPGPGAVFAGWLGACNGSGSCIVDVNGDTSVTANFAQDAIGAISLDIDDDGNYDALTDGILVIRYLFGLTGSTLTSGATAVNANRTDPAQVLNYLDDIEPVLDIDGNGQADAMTDGLIVLRYLFGMRGAVLVQDAIGAGAMRSTAEMEAYLQGLTP